MQHVTPDELVFQAILFRRYVGAELRDIRGYVGVREDDPSTGEDARRTLARLEEKGQVVRVGKRWLLAPEVHAGARGRAFRPEFQSADVGILLALLGNHRQTGPSTLVDLIAMADGINKAIPTLDELHGALNRLAAARLIRVRRDRYEVTDRALDLHARARAARNGSGLDHWTCLQRLLSCPCCGIRLKEVRWRIPLTEAEYRQANEQYAGRFRPRARRTP